MFQDHFDSLETRDPAPREKDLFARLPAQIARAMSAPGWKKHLAGVDAKSVNSRTALAPDGPTLIILGSYLGNPHALRFWNLERGVEERTLILHASESRTVGHGFSPDGRLTLPPIHQRQGAGVQ